MGSHIPRDTRRQKTNEHDQAARHRRNSFKQYLREIDEKLNEEVEDVVEVFLTFADAEEIDITNDVMLEMDEMDLKYGPIESIERQARLIAEERGYTESFSITVKR